MSSQVFRSVILKSRSSLLSIRNVNVCFLLQTTSNNTRDKFIWTQRRFANTSVEDFLNLNIQEKEKETYIDAELVATGREGKVINIKSDTACALCKLNLKNLNYTDVMILSQFIKKDGSLATYHESKLCSKQYIRVKTLIKQAQRCNLIKRPADYFVPGAWHDFNTYLEPDRKRDQPMKVIKKEYWKL